MWWERVLEGVGRGCVRRLGERMCYGVHGEVHSSDLVS